MQNPAVVGVPGWRRAVAGKARIFGQLGIVTPVFQVKRRVGQDIVGFQVRVLVAEEGVRRALAKVSGEAANGKVHLRQLVGGGRQLLTVQGDIAAFPLMAFNKLHRLDKHPRRAAAGVINFALERFEHFGQQRDHAFWRIELTTAFTFGGGKLAEEVFVHATDQVLFRQRFHVGFMGQRFDVVDGIDQRRQLLGFQILTAEIVVRQRAFQRRVALLNGREGGIDAHGNIILLGVLLDERPARLFRQIEDVVLLIKDFHLEEIALAFVFHLLTAGFKLIADKFEEHEAQHHVFVLGGFYAAAKLVRGIP